jgi:hypothetical protein
MIYKFKFKDLKECLKFLKMKIIQFYDTIKVTQEEYVKTLLKEYQNLKLFDIPIKTNLKLKENNDKNN